MAAYLFCLTASGGVPVFSRTKGDLKPLPFPVIGSLNGVHLFANSHDVNLVSTVTDDSKIIWRVFHDSLTLIVIAEDDNADNCHLNNLLARVFDCMVMLLGFDDVINIKNVERFKKESKVCYQFVDRLMGQVDCDTFADLTDTVDIIAAPETSVLQNFLDAFTEAADSPYGCLFVHGKVAVATARWWSLKGRELVLISQLMSSFQPCSSRDVPVFLPDASPNVPHRLLTFELIRNVEVCVLCGPSPSLADLEDEVGRFWSTSYELLRAVSSLHPRNFPHHTTLDSSILGFLLVNTETHRCLCSVHPHPTSGGPASNKEQMSAERRNEILRSFYKHVVGTYFSSNIDGSEKGPSEFTHAAQETYVTTDTHKCYALQAAPHQLYVLYHAAIPTFAMRSVSHKTLSCLVKDKHIQV